MFRSPLSFLWDVCGGADVEHAGILSFLLTPEGISSDAASLQEMPGLLHLGTEYGLTSLCCGVEGEAHRATIFGGAICTLHSCKQWPQRVRIPEPLRPACWVLSSGKPWLSSDYPSAPILTESHRGGCGAQSPLSHTPSPPTLCPEQPAEVVSVNLQL